LTINKAGVQKASGCFLDGVQALCWVVDGLREHGLSLQVVNHIGDAYRNFMDATIETDVIIREIGYYFYFIFCFRLFVVITVDNYAEMN
jgi:hypothetical protein